MTTFRKFANTFLLLKRTIAKKKIRNKKCENFVGPRYRQICVLNGQWKQKNIEFFFIFGSKKIKEVFPSYIAGLKTF